MTKEQYRRRVLQIMDEVHPMNESDIVATYGVDRFIDDATNEILRAAPLHAIPFRDDFGQCSVEDLGDGTGRIKLPDGFLRLAEFKMQGWERSVTRLTLPYSPEQELQGNNITRGGVSKPVATLQHNHIYYYSLPPEKNPIVEIALCIKERELGDEFPSLLGDCVTWLAAWKVLSVAGDTEQSKVAETHYKQLFEAL